VIFGRPKLLSFKWMNALEHIDQLHRYSVDEYEDLILKGAFEDKRVELIDGLILDMSPKSDAHSFGVNWFTEWLARNIDWDRYWVGVENALRLDPSMPEPDIMLVPKDKPKGRRLTASPFVIEVALSSRDRDLTIKPRLYAPAVREYWVLDLQRRRLVVHRDPDEDGYRSITSFGEGDVIAPEALELPAVDVAELLRAVL
jgi:Uma2 family endonuclease